MYSMTRLPSMPQDADTTTFGRGIVDPGGQLRRGEPAEHHRVHRADPGAGEHGDDRLGDHRHVDHHPVAGAVTQAPQHAGEPRDLDPAARR